MRIVRLGSDGAYLRLTADEAPGPPQYLVAELCTDGLSASREVSQHYANGFRDLAEFFRELASEWRGWTGVREWVSLEGDPTIEARHAYGHVQLRVTVRRDGPGWGNEGWAGRRSHGRPWRATAPDRQRVDVSCHWLTSHGGRCDGAEEVPHRSPGSKNPNGYCNHGPTGPSATTWVLGHTSQRGGAAELGHPGTMRQPTPEVTKLGARRLRGARILASLLHDCHCLNRQTATSSGSMF
ncbi:DUF6228 family protein [Micromonospora maris]|uniref:DUF6228 family protein n=1 Tax=Micromonospora maris TaxID=1003110 RepID=UPI003990D1C5